MNKPIILLICIASLMAGGVGCATDTIVISTDCPPDPFEAFDDDRTSPVRPARKDTAELKQRVLVLAKACKPKAGTPLSNAKQIWDIPVGSSETINFQYRDIKVVHQKGAGKAKTVTKVHATLRMHLKFKTDGQSISMDDEDTTIINSTLVLNDVLPNSAWIDEDETLSFSSPWSEYHRLETCLSHLEILKKTIDERQEKLSLKQTQ